MQTQIWRHTGSGEVVVTTVDEAGHVHTACYPYYKDIDACIFDGFDSDPELVDDLNKSPEVWARVDNGRFDTLGMCPACDGPEHVNPCVNSAGNVLPGYPRTPLA